MIDTSDHKLRKCLQNSPQANSISLSGASQVLRNIFLTLQITRGLSLSAPKYCQSMATIENIFPFIDKTRLEQYELVISECDKKIRDCSIFKRRKHTMHKKTKQKISDATWSDKTSARVSYEIQPMNKITRSQTMELKLRVET